MATRTTTTVKAATTVKTYYPAIEKTIPADVQRHLQIIYSKLNNHALAFGHVAASAAAAKGGQQTITGEAASEVSILQQLGLMGAGTVNDQRVGVGRGIGPTYITQQSDNGALVVIGDPSSPVTVTLSTTVAIPWACFFSNHGATMAGLVPQTGIITYTGFAGGPLMPLPPEYWCMVVFDGINFFAAVQPLVSPPSVFGFPYRAVTADYTIEEGDYQIEATANSFTITLPTAAAALGTTYSIKNSGTGIITVATTAAETIDGSTTQTLTRWDNLTVTSNNAGWIIV